MQVMRKLFFRNKIDLLLCYERKQFSKIIFFVYPLLSVLYALDVI